MQYRRATFGLFLFAVAATPVRAEDVRARGVNPAENDTRADIILKYNWLSGGAGIFTTTLKFDYRVTPELGLNFEMPVLGHFHAPSPGPGLPGINDTGIGDVFMRFRYIVPLGSTAFGATSFGVAAEAVLPTATRSTLGTGAYQANVSALIVQAWSPTLITAFVAKAAQSIDTLPGRAPVQENTVRIVQAFILPRGMFAVLDAKYNWETVNRRDVWWEGALEVGMMLNAQTSASMSFSRKWGDRRDLGAVTLGVKRFF